MNEHLLPSKLVSLLKTKPRLMVSTGAGISAESGVPTFRGPGGLWNDFKPEDVATPEAFSRDPKKVWEWYDWRRQLLKDVQPNPGHYALKDLQDWSSQFFLFTQNIDGLHQKAGSNQVYELHGNIWRVRCWREGTVSLRYDTPLAELPPRCACGSLLRPDVVWFGEALPADIIDLAWKAASQCDVFFLVGSSASVQPAASLAWVAKEHGALLIEINPEETAASDIADESFREKSGVVLPGLVEALKE